MQASGRNKKHPRSRYAVLGMLSMGLETGYALTPAGGDETLKHLQDIRSENELASDSRLAR